MSTDWTVQVWQSGNTYTADDALPRPNSDIETKIISNLQIIKLADGSEGYIQPETKYFRDIISMFFAQTTSAFRTQIETYIANGDRIKITTHTGEIFEGYFIDIYRVWFSGMDNTYDCKVSFKQMVV
jgi:hypothetical protein